MMMVTDGDKVLVVKIVTVIKSGDDDSACNGDTNGNGDNVDDGDGDSEEADTTPLIYTHELSHCSLHTPSFLTLLLHSHSYLYLSSLPHHHHTFLFIPSFTSSVYPYLSLFLLFLFVLHSSMIPLLHRFSSLLHHFLSPLIVSLQIHNTTRLCNVNE